jgi:hypothetical protein
MSQTYGKTRWRRFAVVMVPTLAVTAAVGVSVAQGALAASFSVSGTQFKVSASSLTGKGFTQYGTVDVQGNSKGATGEVPVAVSGFNSATINDLCQSVIIPTPLGDYTLTINAGGDPSNPVTATKLFIDMTDLKATTATFNNINIGVAAGTITNTTGDAVNPSDNIGDGSGFAQEADSATLTGVQQTAWATSAGTFSLNGMHLNVASGDKPCF